MPGSRNRILDIELVHELGEVVGVGIEIVALPRLVGAAVASAVVRDHTIAL
jgi:hypothetical protein